MRRYHPDGSEPDPDRYRRYAEIGEVLLHPQRKYVYDTLPKGHVWIDSEVRAKIEFATSAGEKPPFTPADTDSIPQLENHFDWFAVGACRSDEYLAQEWYRSLLAVAPIFNYTRAIRVLLHDDEPRWVGEAGILMIPRHWTPAPSIAFGLFAVVVNPHPIV